MQPAEHPVQNQQQYAVPYPGQQLPQQQQHQQQQSQQLDQQHQQPASQHGHQSAQVLQSQSMPYPAFATDIPTSHAYDLNTHTGLVQSQQPLRQQPLGTNGYYVTEGITTQQQQQQLQHAPQQLQPGAQGQVQPTNSSMASHISPQSLAMFQPSGPNRRKTSYQYGSRFHPVYPSPASSDTTPTMSHASLSPMSSSTLLTASSASTTSVNNGGHKSATPQLSPSINAALPIDSMASQWAAFSTPSPASTASVVAAATTPLSFQQQHSLEGSATYQHAAATPLFTLDTPHSSSLVQDTSRLSMDSTGLPIVSLPSNNNLHHNNGKLPDNRIMPSFDVKAYTFRKKPRHYVAVKHKNALRIEPIIYLKTSILDNNRQPVKNWDYLRFSSTRFRENALPKKKLSGDEMRGARILDVEIVLVSPNNRFRVIEDSCPACVMRMDGERRIMQVLAKNFKLTPLGEPVIDIRKGHAIVCIKLNCYCDHHNEQEGFSVRLQTFPETVRMGGSVKLRICCEARTKNGAQEQDQEEEDGLTDIDAPVSTGSRSPNPSQSNRLQSPSLSYGSQSPSIQGQQRMHQRTPSTGASSVASSRSLDDRNFNGFGHHNGDPSLAPPPSFRSIYPLTPSEGTCMGGTRVTIHGAHFDTLLNPVVVFGSTPAELVTVSHHDVMECTTPPALGLKPGIVAVRIFDQLHSLMTDTESVDYMYLAPLDYDFYNLAAKTLSFGMSNEFASENNLSYLFNAHGGGGSLTDMGLGGGSGGGNYIGGFDGGVYTWAAKESMTLEFLTLVQQLLPGRPMPTFVNESGHSLLHMAVARRMKQVVSLLLTMGVEHSLVDKSKKTALDFAKSLADPELIQVLEDAPAVSAASSSATTSSSADEASLIDSVVNLMRRHAPFIKRVLTEEQERKDKNLQDIRDRSLELLRARNRPTMLTASNAATHQPALGRRTEDEGDDILLDIGGSSSSTSGKSDDDEDDGDDEAMDGASKVRISVSGEEGGMISKKRRSIGNDPTSPRKALKESRVPDVLPEPINPNRLKYIKGNSGEWEKAVNINLPVPDAMTWINSTPLQTWVCQAWTELTSNHSEDQDMAEASDSAERQQSLNRILALTATGLHVYPEKEESHGFSALSRQSSVKHWSLIEITKLEESTHGGVVSIEMCGMVNRGEKIQFRSAFASEIVQAIQVAQAVVTHRLEWGGGDVVDKDDTWFLKTVGIWTNVASVAIKSGELEDLFKITRLDHPGTAAALNEDTDHDMSQQPKDQYKVRVRGDFEPAISKFLLAAVFKSIRLWDQCRKVDLSGVKPVAGWQESGLLKELTTTVQQAKHVKSWAVEGCGWTAPVAHAFVQGLQQGAVAADGVEHISLADNRLEGDNSIGHALAGCFEKLKDLRSIDLTNCDIGTEGMRSIAKSLRNKEVVRLSGNRVDGADWWELVDGVLERSNDLLRVCVLNAPVRPVPDTASLISGQRLLTLSQLVELDLGSCFLNDATLQALELLAAWPNQQLKKLSLAHCNLAWPKVSKLFGNLCKTNRTTKLTLDVSQNPLFRESESVEVWARDMKENTAQVALGITLSDIMVSDSRLGQVIQALQTATVIGGLDMKGIVVLQEAHVAELESMSYDDAWRETSFQHASEATCQELSKLLADNRVLVDLDVSGRPARPGREQQQRFGGFGKHLPLIFKGLADNQHLRILEISLNQFGDQAMGALADALKKNSTLRVLTMDGNDAYSLKGLEPIERVLTPAAFEGTAAQAQESGYNSSLSLWKFSDEEINMHLALMTTDITRLTTALAEVELKKDQATRASVASVKAVLSSIEAEAETLMSSLDRATKDRTRYIERCEAIGAAVVGNYRRK